jgi:hypothetical protein
MGWSRRRKIRAGLLAIIVTVSIVMLLVFLWVPISEEQAGYSMIGLRLYSYESVSVFDSPTANFTYREVAFDFHASVPCVQNTGGGNLCASATQPVGVSFSFNITFPPSGPSPGPWITWVSPNQHEAVEIEADTSNGLAHLLVAS